MKNDEEIRIEHPLKKARKEEVWTQGYVAEKIGVTDFMISRWETGVYLPNTENRKLLCELFNKTPQELGLLSKWKDQQVTLQGSFYSSVSNLPPTDCRIVLQRRTLVEDIYVKLTQGDSATLVLTGIGGIGKSTLAALVYQYVEALRLKHECPFVAETLWLSINPGVTVVDIAEILFAAFEQPISNYAEPQRDLIKSLHTLLTTTSKLRLIILDQFENLLDVYGQALSSDTGEWIDALNSQSHSCRLLLTSRQYPQGMHKYPPLHMHPFFVPALTLPEGIELFQKWNVVDQQATTDQLRKVVTYSEGHPYALALLASLLHSDRSLTLDDFLSFSPHANRWNEKITDHLLRFIYEVQIDKIQRQLLRAFSVYREPVSLNAAMVLINNVSQRQIALALESLLTLHLLHARGKGCYQLHAIVKNYALNTFDKRGENKNKDALQNAHKKAATYYFDKATLVGPSMDKRMRASDMQSIVEAIWHLCQAEQLQDAYMKMEQEHLFLDLHRLGGNVTLLELYQLLLPLDKWCKKPLQAINVYRHLSDVCEKLGQMENAVEYLRNALRIAEEIKNHNEKAYIYYKIGIIYETTGKIKQALEYYENAIKIFQTMGNTNEERRILIQLGALYNYFGEIDRAKSVLEQALQMCNGTQDVRDEGAAYNNLGWIYNWQERKKEALEYYMKALQKYREVKDWRAEAWTLVNLGDVHNTLNQREVAINHLENALSIFKKVQHRRGDAWSLTKLGEAYCALGQNDRAYKYLKQAHSIFDEIGDPVGRGTTFNNFGLLYHSLDQKEQAQNAFREAWNAFKALENHREKGKTLLNISSFYFKQQRYDTALASLLLAKECFGRVKSPVCDIVQKQVGVLCEEIGDDQFAIILTKVKAQMAQVIEQALDEMTVIG